MRYYSNHGYPLFLATNSDDNNLNHTNDNISDYISAIGGTLETPVALIDNTWGFAINKNSVKTDCNQIINNFDDVYNNCE